MANYFLFLLSLLLLFGMGSCRSVTSKNDSQCSLSNVTVSVADALRFHHCSLGHFYLNDIRYHILSEIFDFQSPPSNVSLSPELVRNLTDAYYRNSSTYQYSTIYSGEEPDSDVTSRIYYQEKGELRKAAKPEMVRSYHRKARLEKKIIPHTTGKRTYCKRPFLNIFRSC